MSLFSLQRESISNLIEISMIAGKAIMDIYETDFDCSQKKDRSPVTLADIESHKIISESLAKLTPKIPVLSEESSKVDFNNRVHWSDYWLVDPLDGTKEFIKKNGEFTTNIALMRDKRPIFGIIHAPVLNETYWGSKETGAHFLNGNIESNSKQIMVSSPNESKIKLVTSRSHPSPDLKSILSKLGSYDLVEIGSSLKFCKIAKGEADCYLRLGPTSEWDTAAGEAIAESAGALIFDLKSNLIEYNKIESYLNPSFFVASNKTLAKKLLVAIESL